jgi:spermidine/putrescine ABC transporter ATP-binding subunit
MAEISFDRVSKRFGGNLVVRSATFEARKGEFLSLLGPSGCGKTTLLRMIAGLAEPDGGDIFIRGRAMRNVPPNKRDVAIVFQNYALFPYMTVSENVAFGLQMRRVPRAETTERVARALDAVRLPSLGHRFPRELSGGQQQRVALARALVCQPAVLLLDEPLAALDKNLRADMQIELKQLQRDFGVTTIFVTHDQEEALALSDRILVMNQGEIEQIGTPADIYINPASRFVLNFVGKANIFEGRLVETGQGKRFQAEDIDLPVDTTVASGEAVFALRPEHIDLSDSQPASGGEAFQGVVTHFVYLGSHDTYRVRLPSGRNVTVSEGRRGKSGPRFTVGSQVWASWERASGCLLGSSRA